MIRSVVSKINKRAMARQSQQKLASLFRNREIIQDSPGVWRLEPMTTEQELNDFYRDVYWLNRGDGGTLLRSRDFRHFLFLREFLHGLNPREVRKAINFGSGHGGMSRLLIAANFQVVNVDPFDAKVPGCEHRPDLKLIEGPIDLVYASHSLEHVVDLAATLQSIVALLRPGGLLFVEVPNSLDPIRSVEVQGSRVPVVDPPHTFYMSEHFFEQLPLDTISLEVDHGVIQFLGRKGGTGQGNLAL